MIAITLFTFFVVGGFIGIVKFRSRLSELLSEL
jgi:hypothetical protein